MSCMPRVIKSYVNTRKRMRGEHVHVHGTLGECRGGGRGCVIVSASVVWIFMTGMNIHTTDLYRVHWHAYSHN